MLVKMSGMSSGSDNRGELECGQLAVACLSLGLHIEFPNFNYSFSFLDSRPD